MKMIGLQSMIIEQYFGLKVAGEPKTEIALDRFRARVHIRMRQVDSDIRLEETSFGKARYRFLWVGTKANINIVDDAYKTVVKYAAEYLDQWEMEVLVSYRERGDTA